MGKRASTINPGTYADNLQRQASKDFYQTKQWKRLREKLRKKRRKQHEQIVMSVYKKNPDNDPKQLAKFLESDMPLSELSLKKGIVKVAQVLDHKVAIRKGGAKLSASNLQWITEHQHAKKSGKEGHE